MQLTTLLADYVESGKVIVSENNIPQIEIKATNGKIDINATDKRLIKDILAGARKVGTKGGILKSAKRGVNEIRFIRDIVEDLRKEGVTVTISYRGDRVATIGFEANSILTRFVTGTKGIEINKPLKLATLGL